MQTKQTLKGVKERNYLRQWLGGSILALAIFMLGFCLIPTLIAEASATTATTDVSWAGIYLTLDPDQVATQSYDTSGGTSGSPIGAQGHGDVDFGAVTPTSRDASTGAYGTQKVAKKTIGVTTNGTYYTVFLSMKGNTNTLDTTATDSDQTIAAISDGTDQATFTSAQSFTRTGWGYAVPGTTITGADAAFATTASYTAYDGNLAGSTNDNLTKSGTGSSFYNGGKWAAVPTSGYAQQIWKANNNSGFTSGDTFNVYYSIMVDTDVMSGTYEGEIVYTAMASNNDIDKTSTNLSRSEEFVTSGTTETIKIDLATTDTLTTSNVKVYVVPHRVFAGNNYSVSSFVKADYSQCTVTNLALTTVETGKTTAATITCTMPSLGTTSTSGTISMATDNHAYAATSTDVAGEYDLWVHVDTMNLNNVDFVSKYTLSSTPAPAVVYIGGLQARRNSNNGGGYYVTEMQQMNDVVCSNTNTWGKTIGADARVYPASETAAIAATTKDDSKALATTAAGSAAPGVGTFTLTDNRDSKTYLVRRLADGNCWMVQNLDLNLADFAGTYNLTSENTNLTSRTAWDPAEALATRTWKTDSTKTGGYDTTVGTTGLLEPGVTGSIANNLSISTYQFQSRLNFGPNLFWGSRYQTGTTTDNTGSANNNGLIIANNANAEYARSYDNGLAYIPGTSTVSDPATCKADTATSSHGNNACRMAGYKDNQGGSTTLITQSTDGFTHTNDDSYTATTGGLDTTRQPELITSTDGDTFTMRGSMYIGDYYNWYAATAESGKYDMRNSSYHDSAVANDSICPKGWKLPSNATGDSDSWRNLITTTYAFPGTTGGYSSNNRDSLNRVKQLPLSIPFTGYYNWANGTLNNRGYGGGFWSSTAASANDSTLAYDLDMYYVGYFNTQYSGNKVYGLAIRCVAE